MELDKIQNHKRSKRNLSSFHELRQYGFSNEKIGNIYNYIDGSEMNEYSSELHLYGLSNLKLGKTKIDKHNILYPSFYRELRRCVFSNESWRLI